MEGMELREYSEKVMQELAALQETSIQEYLEAQPDHLKLMTEIDSSNEVLGRLELMLCEFQQDLGNISGEIKTLQDQSLKMTVALNNRRALEKKLDNYLKYVTLSPDLISAISSQEIDENYIHCVNELRDKLRYFKTQGKLQTPDAEITALSMQEVYPELLKLNCKAASRISQFLLTLLHNLNKPKTNVSVLQESIMMKYKDLLSYLRENRQESFIEVCMSYTENLGQIYLKSFKSYMAALKPLIVDKASKLDLVIQDEPRGFFSSPIELRPKVLSFELEDRHHILETLESSDPIVCHVASKQSQRFPLEKVFQSVSSLLLSTCSYNYFFVQEFFSIKPDQYMPAFKEVFSRTFQHLTEQLALITHNSYDLLGLCLILKINEAYNLLMESREIPAMTSFFEKVNMTVWPKVQSLLDLNLRSMENTRNLRATDVCVHVVTSRFAQLAVMLHVVQLHGDMFRQRMTQLRRAYEVLLAKLSSQFKDEKNQCVFCINNLDVLLNSFQGIHLGEEFSPLEVTLQGYVDRFIELQLTEIFGSLLMLLEQMKNGEDVPESQVDLCVRDFNSNWKRGINLLEVMESELVQDAASKQAILRRTYTKLVMHYSELSELVKARAPTAARQLLSVQAVMSELQRT
mmetsp:Transcript_7055/g.12940  ORF Transcript_7055/g.12940 Transcript_7055/m.12940 type:complete len:633 (-) Transcript_7055:727-2625(-)